MSKRGRFFVRAGVVAAVGALCWSAPYTPAREWPIVSSVIAADAGIAVLAVVVAVVLMVLGVRRRRHGWLIVGASACLVSALFGGRCLAQGISNGTVPVAGQGIPFVSWNAGDVNAGDIAAQLDPLIERTDAAVLILPETGWRAGETVAEELDSRGFDNVAFAPESSTTTIIMSAELATSGGYSLDDSAPPWAGTIVRPKTPTADTPVIVGVHVQQPAVTSVDTWRMHVEWVRELCTEERHIAVIGDFNSTVNSLGTSGVGSCADAATANGAGAAATWPTLLPPFLGIAIDRFMVGRGYDVADAAFVVDRVVTGSDHWAIVGAIPSPGRGS